MLYSHNSDDGLAAGASPPMVLIEGCDDVVREVKKRCSLVFLVGEKRVLILIE